MSSIGDLVANLSVNSAGFSQGLNKAQADLKSFSSSVVSNLSGIAGTIGAVFGAKMSLGAAEQDLQATQRLQSVLEATGGAAGLTASEIGKYASELQRSTNFADEVTVQAAAILATFKNIKGDNFKSVLRLAQDFSELKGVGLSESVSLLGKSLNDPIAGLAKLTKAGIMFSDAEEAMIKKMVEMGDVTGAQNILLMAMEQSFGGVAEAAVSPLTQINNLIGDIGEEIGRVLMVAVKPLSQFVIPFLEQWGMGLGKVIVALGVAIGVMRVVVGVQKAIAVGQALIQALAGPVGWTNLAIGAGIFAAALIGINIAMQDTVDTMHDFQGASRRSMRPDLPDGQKTEGELKEEATTSSLKTIDETYKSFTTDAQKLADNIEHITVAFDTLSSEAEQAGKPLSELKRFDFEKADVIWQMIDKFTGFSSKLQDVNDEIRILEGNATAASIELEKMAKAGVPPEKLKELENAIGNRDRAKAHKDEMKRLEDQAKAIGESILTNDEKFVKEKENIEKLKMLGLLTPEQADKATAKAKGDIFGESDKQKPGGVGALAKGSAEASSAIFTAMRSGSDIPKQQLKVEEEQLAQLERAVDSLEMMARGENGVTLVPGSLA